MDINQIHNGIGDNIAGDKIIIGNSQRTLTAEFKESLVSELKKLLSNNMRKISVGIVNGSDGETLILCNEIKKFLIESGLIINEGQTTFHTSSPVFGVSINIQDPNSIAIMVGPKEI